MKRIVQLITAFVLGICACLSWQLCNDIFKEEVIKPQVEKRVSTIREIQKSVGAKQDGIVGPETLSKWKKAVCNQYAKRYFEKVGK